MHIIRVQLLFGLIGFCCSSLCSIHFFYVNSCQLSSTTSKFNFSVNKSTQIQFISAQFYSIHSKYRLQMYKGQTKCKYDMHKILLSSLHRFQMLLYQILHSIYLISMIFSKIVCQIVNIPKSILHHETQLGKVSFFLFKCGIIFSLQYGNITLLKINRQRWLKAKRILTCTRAAHVYVSDNMREKLAQYIVAHVHMYTCSDYGLFSHASSYLACIYVYLKCICYLISSTFCYIVKAIIKSNQCIPYFMYISYLISFFYSKKMCK